MTGPVTSTLAWLSLALHQPLHAFCDIETTHGDRLVTKRGDYISALRINGLRRMCTRREIEDIAEQQRIELQGLLEHSGHAIVGWYVSDPESSAREIDRLSLESCRNIAGMLGLNLRDVLGERLRRWPEVMRWEAAYYVLWTRQSILTREEKKQVAQERSDLAKQFPKVGDSQRFAMRSEILASRHDAFTQRVQTALQGLDISTDFLDPHEALQVTREIVYRETAGSQWKPTLIGDRVMPRLPDHPDDPKPNPGLLLWPAISDQFFNADAQTIGGQLVTVGDYCYAPVDMSVGPEDPRPFSELSATLGRKRIPWRSATILEGGGRASFGLKEVGAGFLAMFPGNGDIRRAFANLKSLREQHNHNAVRFRMTTATWAPVGEEAKLRRQASALSQAIEGWGNCKASRISGDPLEAAMGSVPTLTLGGTATPSLAPVGDAFTMMPWARSASPYRRGSILFRKPDGAIWAYDPTGGGLREAICDLIIAPPGGGKTVLSNTIDLGLVLSSASLSGKGAKLPFLGKIDIGPGAKGFVDLLRNALGPQRQHEAVFLKMQKTQGYEVNVFDLQLGLEYPLPLERVFLQNFISLLATPLEKPPFEGMDHLVEDVVDEAYRSVTEVSGGLPKIYKAGTEPMIDDAIERLGLRLRHHDDIEDRTYWRDIVDALIDIREYRLAGIAQRHAVPVLQDLLRAARTPEITKRYEKISIETGESLIDVFDRYIMNVIKNHPTLAAPTRLDLGDARVIMIDLAEVAPKGSSAANRQTALMYMLARQLLARNFFLHPDYVDEPIMPAKMRAYHLARFTEMQETIKRIDFDEWHRAQSAPQVDAQAVRDVREGRKHNIQLGFISQYHTDFSDELYGQSTARWVLRSGDEKVSNALIERFQLSPFSAYVVRNALPGPGRGGAPFFLQMKAGQATYEQHLINVLGPIELWSFSSTPGDTALRARLFAAVPSSIALRQLAVVFPGGSAVDEITRRKDARIREAGLGTEEAEDGVIDELAREILDGRGIAAGVHERVREMDHDDDYLMAAE
ncbi:secretion protein [Kozakia baliensis]|uniref:Secretion protein n=2 Tax=Kozakia baliensis TaxID=153496 RepID=A0A1D8UXS6_9PROT|nr:secretion protein [Kozakia baliensis]AOX18419.1 secretion protein [Kozakia baliensis]GEL65141.1 virulence protein IcmB [Kozakia baliensis]